MKAICNSSCVGIYNLCGPRKYGFMPPLILVMTLLLCFSECRPNYNETETDVANETASVEHFNSTLKISSTTLNSSEADYDDYYQENKSSRKHPNSKIAQVVIYFMVIFISLGGVLIKYFVTQYETSQIKAQEQLNYHRLNNQAS